MEALFHWWLAFQEREKVLFWSLLLAMVLAAGAIAYNSEIQAFPEFTNTQVQIITQYPGKAAEEVERLLTIPLETATTGIPGLINRRSISLFGLSVITLTFDDNTKSKQARIDVAQRMNDVDLPEGIKPSLSPDSTPVGEIYRFTLSGDLPVDEQRLIQDWTIERELRGIQGVADVITFGGPTRTIEVQLNIPQISAMGISVTNVAQALAANHLNAGGSIITRGEEAFVVRSIGLYERPEALENAVISTQHGVPIRVRDIGTVRISHKVRLGQVGRNDDDDVVEGIVLLRQGSDTLKTCAEIRDKVAGLNNSILPKGLKVKPFYERTELIRRSSHTVFHNILFGILLVGVVLVIGLGFDAWAMIIGVALIIPFALLVAMVGVKLFGLSPNLISLGAVDFGILIETAIFAAEEAIHAASHPDQKGRPNYSRVILNVLGPAFLCAFLLILAFIPILSLERVEGRIFRPLGITLVSALIGGQLGALIFVPALARFIPVKEHRPALLDRFFDAATAQFIAINRRLARVKSLTWASLGILSFLVGLLWAGLGREFLPNLNEGALYIRSIAPPTISLEKAVALANGLRARIRKIPEVTDVITQIGRPDDGTDVNGFDNIETFVLLKSPDEWKSAATIDGFARLFEKKFSDIDGVVFNFSQPIKDNVDEAISGVKGELVIKLFGPQLTDLQKYAEQIAKIVRAVPGAADVATEQLLGQPELRFTMNRDVLARYGLRVADAEEVLETALQGKTAARMLDQQGRAIDVVVKPDLAEKVSQRTLAAMRVVTPDGAKIPLSDLSSSELTEGAARVYREQGKRRIAIKCSVRGRAVVDFVKEANRKIASGIELPPPYYMVWSGSFENAERAIQQFAIVVPICLLAMIIVLYSWFKSWAYVALLFWEIPFSALGGLLALNLFGLNLSISAAAGGIVLIGVSLLTGMMLINDWILTRSAYSALEKKVRAILISNGVAIVGLIPAAFSTGIGSETAKPFAVMILGGLITSMLLSLALFPALLDKHTQAKIPGS